LVLAAEAKLSQIEKDYKRVQRIRKADPGAISKAAFDRAQMAFQTIQAELMQARRLLDQNLTALSYGSIVSPISGRLIERYADPGDTARQGEAVLRMFDPASLREAHARESVASKLAKGQYHSFSSIQLYILGSFDFEMVGKLMSFGNLLNEGL
jgi:multidrug resistance efflux pump